jgi:uncharacterized protein (TIGR02246 family)
MIQSNFTTVFILLLAIITTPANLWAICNGDINKSSEKTAAAAYDTSQVIDAATEMAHGLTDAAGEFDPAAFAGHLSEDVIYIFSGRILEGRQAVEDHYTEAWDGVYDGSYYIDHLDVHVLGATAAVVTSETSFELIMDADSEEPVTGSFIFSAVIERSGENWNIIHMTVSN